MITFNFTIVNTYYLLKKTSVPLLIVECGFMSNPSEADMLTTDKYQEQVEALYQIIENRKKLYSDYQQLYTEGKCSLLDYQEIGLTVTEAECIHSNLSDYLWLYKWMRAQEK